MNATTELTPAALEALEIIVGVREPKRVERKVIMGLMRDGWVYSDHLGQVFPTDAGVRATNPEHMKDITP